MYRNRKNQARGNSRTTFSFKPSIPQTIVPKSYFTKLTSEVIGFLPLGAVGTGFGSGTADPVAYFANGGAGRAGSNCFQVHLNSPQLPWNTGRPYVVGTPNAANGVRVTQTAGSLASTTQSPYGLGNFMAANDTGIYQNVVVHASSITVHLQPGIQNDNVVVAIAPQCVTGAPLLYTPSDLSNRPFGRVKTMSSQGFAESNVISSKVKMRDLVGMTKEQYRNACKESDSADQDSGVYSCSFDAPAPLVLYDWFVTIQTIDNVQLAGNPDIRVKVTYWAEFFKPVQYGQMSV